MASSLNSLQTPTESKDNVDDSESIASDESEEMIEVDEDEFDSRRAICVADMKELEAQFLKLKEDLIYEKQILIDQKLREIEEETAEEYTNPLQKLKQNMETKIKLTTLMRDYKLKNLEHLYQYEVMSIKQSLENDKALLYDKQVNKLETEIQKVEESKRQFMLDFNLFKLSQSGCLDFDDDDDNEVIDNDEVRNGFDEHSSGPSHEDGKKKRPRTSNNSNKSSSKSSNCSPVVLFPGAPYIVYSLQDYDLLEDLSILKMHNNIQNSTSL